MTSIRVLTSASEVAPFMEDVVLASDADRDALGFFAASVYAEYCRRGRLFVLVVEEGGVDRYAGHLLFDLGYPKARVRQIHIDRSKRGGRLGSALLDQFKVMLTAMGYIAIYARVAEDLADANRFWESQGFYTQRIERGGNSRKRLIVVRVHELDSPQLFGSSGLSSEDPLGLDIAAAGEAPLYLLDLNVLFDLGPRRKRHPLAIDVFRAERMRMVSLAISAEIESELLRTTIDAQTDPMLAFAGTLARFPVPAQDVLDEIVPELAQIVFPERAGSDTLSPNDWSDLRHLATAIHCGVRGLITSDGKVLASAPALSNRFGIEVLSPSIFQAPLSEHEEPATHLAPSSEQITVELADAEDSTAIQSLLRDLDIGLADQVRQWAATDVGSRTCVRLVARTEEGVAGYLARPATLDRHDVRAYVAIRENARAAKVAAQALIQRLLTTIPPGQAAHLHLSCPKRQAILREVALAHGFTVSTGEGTELRKVAVKHHLLGRTWDVARQSLLAVSDLRLPEVPPVFRHVDQQIPVVRKDGQRAHVSIDRLESLLSPALLCLDGRQGVMVPIQRRYEELLIAQSPQSSFLPQSKAQLSPQRLYVSSPRTLGRFQRGDLLLIYESLKDGGSGSVVAIGRVVKAYHSGAVEGGDVDLAGSIFTQDQLGEIGRSVKKTVTVFDNVLRMPRPVPMRELKALGCGSPQQLLTAQRLSSEQIQAILEKGFQ